jgi:hypothetical protein
MPLTCPNCNFPVPEELIDSVVRDADAIDAVFLNEVDEQEEVWRRDYAGRCAECRVVISKSESNVSRWCSDWSFHRLSDLRIVTQVYPEEFEAILDKIRRYALMHRKLATMFSMIRDGEVVYRFATLNGQTGLAVCYNDGVIQTFSTLKSL